MQLLFVAICKPPPEATNFPLFNVQESCSVGEWIGAVSTEVEWIKNLESRKIAASDYEKKVRIL